MYKPSGLRDMPWFQPNSAGIGSGGAGQSIVPDGGTGLGTVEQVEPGPAMIGGGGFGPGAGREFAVRRWCTAKASAVMHASDVCQSRDNNNA
jgi:hypothetical protein